MDKYLKRKTTLEFTLIDCFMLWQLLDNYRKSYPNGAVNGDIIYYQGSTRYSNLYETTTDDVRVLYLRLFAAVKRLGLTFEQWKDPSLEDHPVTAKRVEVLQKKAERSRNPLGRPSKNRNAQERKDSQKEANLKWRESPKGKEWMRISLARKQLATFDRNAAESVKYATNPGATGEQVLSKRQELIENMGVTKKQVENQHTPLLRELFSEEQWGQIRIIQAEQTQEDKDYDLMEERRGVLEKEYAADYKEQTGQEAHVEVTDEDISKRWGEKSPNP